MATPDPEPKRRLFNRAECYRMGELEILGPEERTELIEGQIICKIRPMTPALVASIHKSVAALQVVFGEGYSEGYMVAGQYPLVLSEFTELEPDVLIVPGKPDDYGEEHPGPADAVLVIEIADQPNAYDREWKARLYAENGIADYWFINLAERLIEVRRQPESGKYLNVEVFADTEAITTLAIPDKPVFVADLLPLNRSAVR